MDGVAPLLVVAEHADVDVAVLEVRRQIDGVDGHELGREGQFARDDGAEFAQDEFFDAGGAVFHGEVDYCSHGADVAPAIHYKSRRRSRRDALPWSH